MTSTGSQSTIPKLLSDSVYPRFPATPYSYFSLLNSLALLGIGVSLLMLLCHLGSICYARYCLQRVYPRSSPCCLCWCTSCLSICLHWFCARSIRLVALCFVKLSPTSLLRRGSRPRGPTAASPRTSLRHPADADCITSTSPSAGSEATEGESEMASIIAIPSDTLDKPGVSIIKPIAGLDPNLDENLTSFFHLDYPHFELVFCAADPTDPACAVVKCLQQSHPNVDSRLVFAEDSGPMHGCGVNPKVQNLQAGYRVARHDLLLISDSGIWMRPNTLSAMVAELESSPRVGLVHQLPFVRPEDPGHDLAPRNSLAWIVQMIFFGCWHAKVYISANLLRINCTVGMSCLLRKSIIDPIGGFKSFGCYLAEDYFLGLYIARQGWQTRLAPQPAWQNSPSPSLYKFYSRISRWSQLRLRMVTLSYILEPLSRCLPVVSLGTFGFAYLMPSVVTQPSVWFAGHCLVWFLLDYYLLRAVYPADCKFTLSKLHFLAGWLVCELMVFPLYVLPFVKTEVVWRSRRFRIRCGGLTEELPPRDDTTDDYADDGGVGGGAGFAIGETKSRNPTVRLPDKEVGGVTTV